MGCARGAAADGRGEPHEQLPLALQGPHDGPGAALRDHGPAAGNPGRPAAIPGGTVWGWDNEGISMGGWEFCGGHRASGAAVPSRH